MNPGGSKGNPFGMGRESRGWVSAGAIPKQFASRPAALRLAVSVLILGLNLPSGGLRSSPDGWIYLRGGKAPTPDERLVEILAVGDVMPGGELADTPDLFEHVTEALQDADLAIGNMEGVVSVESAASTMPSHILPPGTPTILADAGFDLLSLANNHALDAGPEGLAETRRRLEAAGIEPVESDQAITREIGGLRFSFLAWNDLATASVADLLAAVSDTDAEADHVIVLVHWGQEYQRHAVLPQQELADELLAAGADIVLGSHPHVVQDLWMIDRETPDDPPQVVAYSLGNFVFDQGWDDTAQGLALRLLFDEEGLRAVQALPLWTAPRPRWMNPDDAAALLERILPPERLGFACSVEKCEPVAVPSEQRSGIFGSGAIDLTGDGLPEIIRRQGEAVEVLQGGRSVWRTPPDWRVRDLALGDPNDDGRFELLLALDKAGPGGEATSHPFIVGYRRGTYRDLWGGSPVHAPLLEVELGDLDGDGLEELAAIEASTDGSTRCVTVWRWHGWGFSLVWRSAPGKYRDLILLPADMDQPARLSVSVAP